MASAKRLHTAHCIETISPVNTQKAYHRQHDTYACTNRTLHVEGVEFLHTIPCITRFSKDQAIDIRAGTEHKGVSQFQSETVIGITTVIAILCKRAVVITAHANSLRGVAATIARHAVATDIEGFKWRLLVSVIITQQTEFHPRHQHETLIGIVQGGIGAGLELPLVILNPAVFLLLLTTESTAVIVISQVLIVLTIEGAVRRCQRDIKLEVRAAARIDGVVLAITCQSNIQAYVVTVTVGNQEVAPVLQHIAGIAEVGTQLEVVVGPAQALTPSEAKAKYLHEFIRVVIVLVVVIAVRAVTVEVTVVVVLVVGRVVVVVAHIGLLAEECTQAEGVGPLAAKPGVQVAYAVGLVVASVGLTADAECLTVSLRHYPPSQTFPVEEVGHAEVTELQSYLSYHARLAIAQRELHLVVALWCEFPVQVNRTVHGVGRNQAVVIYFLVEMTQRGNFTI